MGQSSGVLASAALCTKPETETTSVIDVFDSDRVPPRQGSGDTSVGTSVGIPGDLPELSSRSSRKKKSFVEDLSEAVPIFLIQAEGHPSVRVFDAPKNGANMVSEIASHSKGFLYGQRHQRTGSFCMISCQGVKGWVGAKNVKFAASGQASSSGPICSTPGARSSSYESSAPSTQVSSRGGFAGTAGKQASKYLSFDSTAGSTCSIDDGFKEGTATTDTTKFSNLPSASVSLGRQDNMHRKDVRSSTDSSLRSSGYSNIAPEKRQLSGCSAACPAGTKCKQRDSTHLTEYAHPFDPEYEDLCKAAGIAPEMPSLTGIFNWIDMDGSGKVSRRELDEALPLLEKLFEEKITMSDKSWAALDEDGNGCVNFSEFACWAGPRLGLPLGVSHLFQGSAVDEAHGCAILGCPCEGFDPKASRQPAAPRQSSASASKLTRTGTQAFQESASGKESLQLCKCGHKYGAHHPPVACEGEVPYPSYWDERDSSKGEFMDLVEIKGHTLDLFQKVMDATYSSVWTRDRKKHHPDNPKVPKGFSVVSAFRSENSRNWREYGVRRAQLLADVEVARHKQFDDVLSSLAWVGHAGAMADRLKPEVNEWYVFHGSSAENAKQICTHDFRLQYAGKSTGTLYGHGLYFAESATKADEYAKATADGVYTMILARAIGGHCKYTDEVEPDAEELVQSNIAGPYDCVIGDRRATRGTYREFVFYDSENVYAEYIIHYRRNY